METTTCLSSHWQNESVRAHSSFGNLTEASKAAQTSIGEWHERLLNEKHSPTPCNARSIRTALCRTDRRTNSKPSDSVGAQRKPIMIWLANAVLVVHALLASFIVCGLVAIWAGAALGWNWIRQRLFRLAHLLSIVIVSMLSVLGIACPLTTLEDWLRTGSPQTQGFIQRWVSRLLYYDLPTWAFTLSYVAFGLAVLLTWWLIPPRHTLRSKATRR